RVESRRDRRARRRCVPRGARADRVLHGRAILQPDGAERKRTRVRSDGCARVDRDRVRDRRGLDAGDFPWYGRTAAVALGVIGIGFGIALAGWSSSLSSVFGGDPASGWGFIVAGATV